MGRVAPLPQAALAAFAPGGRGARETSSGIRARRFARVIPATEAGTLAHACTPQFAALLVPLAGPLTRTTCMPNPSRRQRSF